MAGVKARRTYSSPLRAEQARATRRTILEAARGLFIAQGYGATSIDEIAAEAGVSKPTVFAAVGNKPTLLREVRDVAIAGDDEPVPVARRPLTVRIQAEPDQQRAVRMLAKHLTGVASRYAEINEVLHAVADSGDENLRSLWEAEEQQRLVGAGFWLGVLTDKAPLRSGLTKSAATDTLWLLMSPDHYYRLVHRRGWTDLEYQRWLADSIQRLLFSHPA